MGHLKEAVEQITKEIKPFDAADFRAREVRERSEADDSEPEEPDAEGNSR